MTVAEFIEKLERFPQDMEIVCVGDYIQPPFASIEKYADRGFDEDGNVITREVVEIR